MAETTVDPNGRTVEQALLEQYSKSIDAMLQITKLSKNDRMILETQRLFVMFMRAYQEDRGKVHVMWRSYLVANRLLWLLIPLIASDVFVRVWTFLYPKIGN